MGREFVVRRVPFPLDRREAVLQNCFKKILKYAFAVAAVGENDDSGFRLFETDDIVTPAVVMALLEESCSIRRSVEAPSEAVAEVDGVVVGRGFVGERRELMF